MNEMLEYMDPSIQVKVGLETVDKEVSLSCTLKKPKGVENVVYDDRSGNARVLVES